MNVTADLVHEHNAILVALDILDRICDRVDAGQEFPAWDGGRIVDFLKNFADGCHHAKEEEKTGPGVHERYHAMLRELIGLYAAEVHHAD